MRTSFIVHLIIISALWYVAKDANSKSVSYKDKATVFLVLYSGYTSFMIAAVIWLVSKGSNKYTLILAIYAMVALISAWIVKFFYMRKI